jgi:hypothetical protein
MEVIAFVVQAAGQTSTHVRSARAAVYYLRSRYSSQ